MHRRYSAGPLGPATIWLALAALIAGGCQRTEGDSSSAAATGAAPAARAAPLEETWEALFLEKTKIGYSHTTIRPVERDGQSLVEIDSVNHLNLTRFGQSTVQDIKMSTVETPEGKVISFTSDAALGGQPVHVTGRVQGAQMIIETAGSAPTRLPWSSDILGFRGMEHSLETRPMKPGERRSLRVLAPLLNVVTEVELKAADLETTDVQGKPMELLRIDGTSRFPDGNSITETMWVDVQGHPVKRNIAAMRQESYRTTREAAMAESPSQAVFDLGSDTFVKLDKPLADAHRTRRARYRVQLAQADPAKVFASGGTQSLRSLDPHTAELTVQAAPNGDSRSGVPGPKAGAQYLAGNSILQVDDPAIRNMAAEAKGSETAPHAVALALENYVHRIVATKDFSQTFATAAEVAKSRQGDCTEHAVLLAALLRACDIPSRVAIGLVYVPSVQGFGYHMWTEAFVDGDWLPLDATLGQGGIGAGHIKLTDSSLEGAGAYSTFLPVAQVVGQLKISVLEAE
jgi:transglutaminase-like putative cysteine protease